MQPERIPVIVGAGEITHRTKDPAEGLEPIALMERALREAERDAGAALLAQVDSLDIVCEVSWPYVDAASLLTKRIGAAPARAVNDPVGGESPVRYIHEAALRIARGESQVGAIVGAESNYSVVSAEKAGVELPWSPKDPDPKIERARHWSLPVTMQHGIFMPTMVYPLYENATLAAWGQTPREALAESGLIWSRFSEVAASNHHAIGQRDDVGQAIDRCRLFDLGHQRGAIADERACFGDVLRALDERQCDPIGPLLKRELKDA